MALVPLRTCMLKRRDAAMASRVRDGLLMLKEIHGVGSTDSETSDETVIPHAAGGPFWELLARAAGLVAVQMTGE